MTHNAWLFSCTQCRASNGDGDGAARRKSGNKLAGHGALMIAYISAEYDRVSLATVDLLACLLVAPQDLKRSLCAGKARKE